MSIKQIDDALIHGLNTAPVEAPAVEKEPESAPLPETPEAEGEAEESNSGETTSEKAAKATESSSEKPEAEHSSGNAELDEYGVEVPKARMYSEEEVQRMIRDRLSRGQHATPQQQQAVKDATANFQPDPNSTDSWEQQLKEVVKNTLNEVTQEEKTKTWQREETERQTNFEVKFTTGMEKFADFKDIVGKMPITDSMLMGVRGMENLSDPAGFVYAAAKLQPKELERISKLPDPFQQAAEMGRLEERMRKNRAISKTAQPLKSSVSDISDVKKAVVKKSIDSLIDSHAKSKLRKA